MKPAVPLSISYNTSLEGLNSFGIAAKTWAVATVDRWLEVESALQFASDAKRPLLVMGGGSNLLFRRNFEGVVVRIRNRGRQVIQQQQDHVWVRVAAGENWNELVLWAASQGLWGIENLALIPGHMGAAPMQNIGAYGVQLADVLLELQCFDRLEQRWRTLGRDECQFGYRSSRFKDADADRFVITECVLQLARQGQPQLDYPGVSEMLAKQKLGAANDVQPMDMANAISAIRQRKLPDPKVMGNAGSFFKNPQVPLAQYESLHDRWPELPAYPSGEQHKKLSAAWMIQHCRWRGVRRGNAGVSDQHSLVLVNHGGATGQEIWQLAREIQASVRQTFGVNLEPEPQII